MFWVILLMDRQTKKQTNAGCHVTSLAEVNLENVISDVHQKGRQCRENTPSVLNYLFVCGCTGGRMCAHLVQHGSGVSCRQTEASSGLWNWCGWKADHYNTNFPFKHFSCKRSDQWDKKNKTKHKPITFMHWQEWQVSDKHTFLRKDSSQ